MKEQAPILFQYIDYRKFLLDYIDYKKSINRKYSYRYFSYKAGFSSTNFLSLVIKGKRNLTVDSIGKIAKGIRLNKQERSFFEDLVFMNQSNTHEGKDYYYKRMLQSKPFSKAKEVSKSCYEYFSRWYFPVIREIVEIIPGPINPRRIASYVRPKVTLDQAKSALKLLQKLNLIEKEKDGKYKKTDAVLTTGDEIQSLQIINFHKAMMKMAENALSTFNAEERDISGVVLSINHNQIKEIKKKVSNFRRELTEMATTVSDEDQVVYVQIHAFPLMQPYKDA